MIFTHYHCFFLFTIKFAKMIKYLSHKHNVDSVSTTVACKHIWIIFIFESRIPNKKTEFSSNQTHFLVKLMPKKIFLFSFLYATHIFCLCDSIDIHSPFILIISVFPNFFVDPVRLFCFASFFLFIVCRLLR